MTIVSPAQLNTSYFEDNQPPGAIVPLNIRVLTSSLAGRYSTTQTGSYTLQATDAGTRIRYNSSAAGTITIPANASVSFDVGTVIGFCQVGTGQLTIAPAYGVTLLSPVLFSTRTQYSTISVIQDTANVWVLSGDTQTQSANDTLIITVGQPIFDASGNAWTITSGAQVAFNANVVSGTSSVIAIAYVNGVVWEQNSSYQWYSFQVVSGVPSILTGPTPITPLSIPTIAMNSTINSQYIFAL